ncbi:J domain-containing protein [Legionella sp. PATHC035]|uniref:J domain-containing protein n=1 Tax=Legionella sp. PATHC035 TaxID=2992040 RepID=UPI0022440B6D|nr:J domain-containing protein [Legionella sp. PATHC035]MCW8410047.1 J domain-containing protein [Legionella sp. PATHC035]
MTIETELKTLVLVYASFDEENKCYISDLNQEALLRLDADFIKLINKLLLNEGPEKTKIKKNYKNLSLYFHPDLLSKFCAEAKWLEKNLSENRNDGACFKTLSLCYEKLMFPQDFKPLKFEDISSREDLKKWLEHLKNSSRTFTERNLYVGLLGLFDQSTGYFDEVGKIKPKGIRALISFLPMVFISFGTFVFAEELFAVYALYFALLKSGQYMESSNSKELQSVGSTLQQITMVSATATTTLLVRLVEMTFWASRQCYEMSLHIGSSLLTPLISAAEDQFERTMADENLCRELILASQNQSISDNFKTPQLKMIAAPIESYLGLLEQQFFRNWRAGGEKYRALDSFLLTMRVLDKDDDLLVEQKIAKAHEALEKVKKKPNVYTEGGKTALAVDRAERVIRLLQDNFEMQPALSKS